MKFELEPNNLGVPNSEIIDDIRKVASMLDRTSLTRSEYDAYGRFGGTTIVRRFGSWNSALETAGLKLNRRSEISAEECLTDLKGVAHTLGKQTLTLEEYKKNGQYSWEAFSKHFGGWINAVKQAGLTVSENYRERISDEKYFENIEKVWQTLGRQPRLSHMAKPLSAISGNAYGTRFGSWRKALEAFVEYVNDDNMDRAEAELSIPSIDKLQTTTRRDYFRKTSRNISWRIRFLVMRRDSFTCKICGSSPATKLGTILHVDHILAYSSGGETEMENLQTLCQTCNIGKSNLEMVDPSQ